jgi:hypothetical protein
MHTIFKITIQRSPQQTDEAFRKHYAAFISRVIDAGTHRELPYFNTDDQFWVLDSMNDWFLRFYDDAPATFSIEHRHHKVDALEAISTWISYKLRGKLEVTTLP